MLIQERSFKTFHRSNIYSIMLFLSLVGVLYLTACTANRPQKDEGLLNMQFRNLLDKGKEAFRAEDFQKARLHLEDAVAINSENQEAHYFLAYTYERLTAADGRNMLDTELRLTQLSSQHFKKVIDINKKYEGEMLILDPYSKLTAIWGSLAMAYLNNNKPDSAKWAFHQGKKAGGYFPAIMELNKNIMATCEKDAILFTNGDNDTFPMWYLQFIEKYRPDITVVNLSLLNTDWYVKQLKHDYPFGTNNLPIALPDADIEQLKAKIFNATEMVIDASDEQNPNRRIVWMMQPTLHFDDVSAIRPQDLMVIHIIENNRFVRPVYFATTVAPLNLIGLKEYMAMEGLAYHLMPEKISEPPVENLAKNLFDVYTYDGVHDEHQKYIPGLNALYGNYRSCFIRLAHSYNKLEQFANALKTIDAMEKKIPEEVIPYSNDRLSLFLANFRQQLLEKAGKN